VRGERSVANISTWNETITLGSASTMGVDADPHNPVGRKISDREWAKIRLIRDDFHGDWNYTIRPQSDT